MLIDTHFPLESISYLPTCRSQEERPRKTIGSPIRIKPEQCHCDKQGSCHAYVSLQQVLLAITNIDMQIIPPLSLSA